MKRTLDCNQLPGSALVFLLLLIPCGATQAAYANLEIVAVDQQIVGTSAKVSGSGSKDNTVQWFFGDSARFILNGDDGTPSANAVTYGVDVRPVSATGGFQPGTDSLMIARTEDSQGLKDTGSLSLYISPAAGSWTGEFKFSFYAGSGAKSDFSTPVSLSVQAASLDLDFNQRMQLYRDELAAYGVTDPTDIVVTDDGGDLIDFQGVGTANFDNPAAAVIARYNSVEQFNVAFSHTSVALFMFEFRNPPDNIDDSNFNFNQVSVPVPATPALILLALGVVLGVRRVGHRSVVNRRH